MKKFPLIVGTTTLAALTLAATNLQDPGSQKPVKSDRRVEVRSDQKAKSPRPNRELQELRQALQQTRAELRETREMLKATRQKLEDCAGLVVAHSRHESNCAPSRSLIGSFQWMHENELQKPARELMTRIVEQHRKDPQRLNRTAWSLMTDEKTAGQFDVAALQISQHAQQAQQKPSAASLDTHALALFLNGRFQEAVAAEKKALAQTRHGKEDFRRRLRMYETAAQATESSKPTRGALIAASGEEEE